MGLTVQLRTKYNHKENVSNDIGTDLSKAFTTFFYSHEMYQNDEFSQLEKLLKIDLSLLKKRVDSVHPPVDVLMLWDELLFAKRRPAINAKKIKKIESEIKQKEEKWKIKFDGNIKDWIEVSELEKFIKLLQIQIKNYPDYFKKMTFNLDWESYFYPKASYFHSPESYAIEDILVRDLDNILSYLEQVSLKGNKLVTFYDV